MRRGFTLVELLVVIAIIATLAGLLFPVIAKARGRGEQTACMSNLRQIVSAALMYADDWDERFPLACGPRASAPGASFDCWIVSLFPYIHNWQIWQCPVHAHYTPPDGWNQGAIARGAPMGLRTSYGISLLRRGAFVGSVPDPSRAVFCLDATSPYVPSPGYCCPLEMRIAMIGVPHNGGANVAFFDGHAKWLTTNTLATDDTWW